MKKILVLCGHPRALSFCLALAERYVAAAEASGHEVRLLRIDDLAMDFSPPDYHGDEAQAAWVLRVQEALSWCEHLVLVTPMWWGGVPAALKMLLDRALVPGFAFRYHAQGLGWDRLLTGRSARLIITADTPWLYFRWVFGRPLIHQLRQQVFGFCGFSPVRVSYVAPVKTASETKRARWLEEIDRLGRDGA